jgi:hypothetical protein
MNYSGKDEQHGGFRTLDAHGLRRHHRTRCLRRRAPAAANAPRTQPTRQPAPARLRHVQARAGQTQTQHRVSQDGSGIVHPLTAR